MSGKFLKNPREFLDKIQGNSWKYSNNFEAFPSNPIQKILVTSLSPLTNGDSSFKEKLLNIYKIINYNLTAFQIFHEFQEKSRREFEKEFLNF